MPKPNRSLAREALFEVIENQIQNRSPRETKLTFDRLCGEGHSPKESMKLIGCVLASELSDMFQEQRVFDEKKYETALKNLPKLPWGDNELT
jgi:hypothetical protein